MTSRRATSFHFRTRSKVPLDPSKLASNLAKLADPPTPADPASAAQAWADAYHAYAMAASGAGIPMSPTGAEPGRFAAAMIPAMNPVTGNPATFAAALSAAVLAYWTGAVFPGGVVVPAPGASAVTPAATPILSVVPQPKDVAYTALAGVLHAATITTTVTIPPASPVPIL